MGQGTSKSLAAAAKEASQLLGKEELLKLERAFDRICHGGRLDAKSFQKSVFGSFIMMVCFSLFVILVISIIYLSRLKY